MAPGAMSTTRRTRPTATQCIAATVLALVVVVAIIVVVWLVLRPAKLHVSVDHAAVSGFNFTSGGALNGTFDLTLRAYNWNKRAGVSYHSLEVGVWFDDTYYLAGAIVPGFFQPAMNETRIDVAAQTTAVASAVALPRDVEASMKKDRTGGKLPVEVHVQAKVRFRYGVVKTRQYKVRASCPSVLVNFSSPSSFDRVYCHVHI